MPTQHIVNIDLTGVGLNILYILLCPFLETALVAQCIGGVAILVLAGYCNECEHSFGENILHKVTDGFFVVLAGVGVVYSPCVVVNRIVLGEFVVLIGIKRLGAYLEDV